MLGRNLHSPSALLSPRQFEVATFVAAGQSTRDIADRLSLSPRTVETHIAAIFEKLHVRSRAQLAALLTEATANRWHAGNLPRALLPLIGRDADLAAVAALVANNRVVTILGTGGLGKTQAALRVAARAEPAYPDGVWFVDLASLTSRDSVSVQIGEVLGLAMPASDDLQDVLARRLKTKVALLLIDNCEHLVDPVAAVVSKLARECPRLSILTTSREPLGIAGEATYRLPALDACGASELFVARAGAVDHRFSIDDGGAYAVAEICRKLDGIPLAIELAAARCNVFSPAQLLARLERRFALLEGGLRDVLPRHQSMRALIDWSYEHLGEHERSLFRRLSIFTGTFDLDGALAVSGRPAESDVEVIDTLTSLIDKSLVSVDRDSDSTTYRLLESMRDYARMKLHESEHADATASLLLRYLRDTLARMNHDASYDSSAPATAFFTQHIGDIRFALDWALRANEALAGAALLVEIEFLWSSRSIDEGISRIETYVAALGENSPVGRSRLLSHLTELYWRSGEQDRAIEAATQALDLARASDDAVALGWALVAEATASIFKDPDRSLRLLCELEALEGTSDATRQEGRQLRARLTYMNDDFEQATILYRELVDEERRAGNPVGEGQSTWMLANIAYKSGDPKRAVELARRARALVEPSRDVWATAMVVRSLAGFLVAMDAYDEAERAATEALEVYADIDPGSAHVGTLVEILAFVAATRGACTRAATLLGFARARAGKPGAVVFRSSTLAVHERLERCLREALAADELETLLKHGAHLDADEAIALAMPHEDLRS